MKSFLPLAVFAIVLASCSTAYKSGQTPDDVYFSPQRPQVTQDEYVRMNRGDDRKYRYRDEEDYEDYYLRMKVRNRDRWSMLDNDLYFYNYNPVMNPFMTYSPFAFRNYNRPFFNNYAFNDPFFPYYGGSLYGNFYNPYGYPYYGGYGGGHVIVTNPRGPVYNRPRTSNLNIFSPDANKNVRQSRSYNNNSYYTPDSYNNNSNSRNTGNDLRSMYNSNNNSYSRPSSSGSSGSSSGSSNSGGGGGNAPVRRF